MKLTYGGQTIDLFDDELFPDGPPDRIFMGLSGGLDSAALLYLICTHFPNIEVHPYTGNDANHPMDYVNAINVNQWFQEHFPAVDIKDSYIFKFDAAEQQWRDKAQALIDAGVKSGFTSTHGVAKVAAMNHMINTYWKENLPGAYRVSGMTSNPPDDVMHEGGFYEVAERRRDKHETREYLSGKNNKIYQPLTNVDKKFVAGVFEEHGLMEDLFELTGSCIGNAKSQGYGMHGCGNCFWCKEKEWAFGVY